MSTDSSICAEGCSLDEAVQQAYISAPLWHYSSRDQNYADLMQMEYLEPWQAFWIQSGPALTGPAELLFPVTSGSGEALTDRSEASRFLAQTTFGPTSTAIDSLLDTNYSGWIDRQMDLPITSVLDAFNALQVANPESSPSRDWVFESFWTRAVTAEDQLRQRMAFALSQLFVIALRGGAVASFPRGVADFYSRLAHGAFGNFRNLLEQVTIHFGKLVRC